MDEVCADVTSIVDIEDDILRKLLDKLIELGLIELELPSIQPTHQVS